MMQKVHTKPLQSSGEIYLLLCVDGMPIAFKSRSTIDKLKDLFFEFEMKDLGEA